MAGGKAAVAASAGLRFLVMLGEIALHTELQICQVFSAQVSRCTSAFKLCDSCLGKRGPPEAPSGLRHAYSLISLVTEACAQECKRGIVLGMEVC